MSGLRRPAAAAVGPTLASLRRFAPRGTRSMGIVAALAVVSGLAEAVALVVITATAISVSAGDAGVGIGPFSGTPSTAVPLVLGLIAVGVAASALSSREVARLFTTVSVEARAELFDAISASSYERRTQDSLATLPEGITTFVDRFTKAGTSLANLVTAVLNLTVFALVSLVIDPLAAIALAVMAGVLFSVLRPATRRTRRATDSLIEEHARLADQATTSTLLAREYAVFGVTGRAVEDLRTANEAVGEEYRVARFLASFVPSLYQAIAFGLAALGLLVVAEIDPASSASIGAVVLLLVRLLSYGQLLLQSMQALAENGAYSEPLARLIDSYRSSPRPHGRQTIDDVGTVTLDAVTFEARDRDRVLDHVSFTLAPREMVGIVGPSGAGKTTLLNLLVQLYQPTSGTILVDGTDLADIDPFRWARLAAMVPQEARLLDASIADNVRFLRAFDDAAVEQALEAAHLAPFVATLPHGADTTVAELGSSLSGGQRQRLILARALVGRPELLLLDEPTSALDQDSERAIAATLDELRGTATVVIVAHRPSTIARCDRLVVLESGRVTAQGDPREVGRSSGFVHRMQQP